MTHLFSDNAVSLPAVTLQQTGGCRHRYQKTAHQSGPPFAFWKIVIFFFACPKLVPCVFPMTPFGVAGGYRT
jgi:hypothetical protein